MIKRKASYKNYVLLLVVILSTSFGVAQEVNWLTWNEAAELAATDKNPKKVFIDVYTDWCGWCKRKGYHEFAATLMQGRLSYPTTIFLDEEMNMLSPVPGYQKPEPFLNIAKYFGENIYKDKDWKTYAAEGK